MSRVQCLVENGWPTATLLPYQKSLQPMLPWGWSHNVSMIFHDYVQLIYAYFRMSGVANVIVGSFVFAIPMGISTCYNFRKRPIFKTVNFLEDEMYMFFVVFFSSSCL